MSQCLLKAEGPGSDYQELHTFPDKEGDGIVKVEIPLVSSVKPDIATQVDFRLPKKTSQKPMGAEVTPPGSGGSGADLASLLQRLDVLIATQQKMLNKATDSGQFNCSRETLGELRKIRKELEEMR